ncbi:MAG: hypothetical protein SFU86_13080 [Pirellulaceae bacterium]|nr:hypothetical protein [Pirellulaceae bacterium]
MRMNPTLPGRTIGWALLLAVLAGGCDTGPKLHTVTGTVAYQGQPVAQGIITFADPAGIAADVAAPIANGRYTLQSLPGERLVRITAQKETGRILTGAMDAKYPEVVDLIPATYNSATTLRRTIEPVPEPQTIDFDLK